MLGLVAKQPIGYLYSIYIFKWVGMLQTHFTAEPKIGKDQIFPSDRQDIKEVAF